MQIRNINRIITTNGDTSDIINTVMAAYQVENDPQIRELAERLRGANTYDTCRNIWRYLIVNIDYKADADGTNGEVIRTPARLVHDGTGDCKSYSLFTATVLRYLGIPHFFRFASYTRRKEATHVYVIAFPSTLGEGAGGEVVIDAVAYEQLKTPFNQEIKYTYKCDMQSANTKISYLAGLTLNAKPGTRNVQLGNINSDDRYKIWIGNEAQTDITPGKAWMYAKYDLLNEQINIATDTTQLAQLYNELTIISAFLNAYNMVNGETRNFEKCVIIICGLIADGKFKSTSVNNGTRKQMFEGLMYQIETNFKNEILPIKLNDVWYNTLLLNVLVNNQIPEQTSISGIGAYTPLADGLKKAGIYFIYLFIPETELKNYPASVAKKRFTQNAFYTLIHKIDIFHNAETVLDFFRSGIIARTGMQPEEYIKKCKSENQKTIGSISLVTISSIIAIILGLLQIIKAIWPNSQAAKYAVSSGAADVANELYTEKQNPKPETQNPTGTDASGKPGITTLLKSSGGLLLAALGLGTLLLTRKK